MNSSQTGPKKHNRYGIEVAADRYFSVNGPAMDRLPGWGAKRESDGLEIHLHPALSFEVHYRVPKWVAIYAFNGAETRGAFDEDTLATGRRARGSVCLVPPNRRVRVIQEQPQELLALVIPAERFAGIADAAVGRGGWRPALAHSENDPALAALCGELRRTMISEPGANSTYLGAIGEAAASRLVADRLSIASDDAAHSGGGEVLAPLVKRRVVAEVERRLGERIAVSELAEAVGLSRSHFSRAFAASFGDSPARYVLQRRLARARELLLETDRSVTQIALACGFADHAHFSTAFRKEVGLAPRAYRKAAERG